VDVGPDRIARFTCFVDGDGLKCGIVAGTERTTLVCKHDRWFRPGAADSRHQPVDALQTIRDVLHDALERRRVAIGGQ
jgi:hypothetical protein